MTTKDHHYVSTAILLPADAGFARVTPSEQGPYRLVLDGASLGFILEELIAHSATHVAIEDRAPLAKICDTLPVALQKRVKVVQHQRALAMTHALFAPLSEEFAVEPGLKSLLIRYQKKVPPEITLELMEIFETLHTFLTGFVHKLQIDIDLDKFRKNLSLLREHSRNPKSRANIAIVEGILQTYDNRSVNSLESSAPAQLLSRFEEFVEDELYKEMSAHSHSLGFPERVERSFNLVNRLAKRLLERKSFRRVFDLVSKAVSTASGLPLPDSELGEAVVKAGYLPPIISLKASMEKARETWKRVKPDVIRLTWMSVYGQNNWVTKDDKNRR